MSDSRRPAFRPDLVRLEARENPSAVWTDEGFDNLTAPALPAGWSNWASDGQTQYITSKLQTASGPNALASLGNSSIQSRTWTTTSYPADYGAGASVRSNAPAALEVIARGSNLNSTAPTYLAAAVATGGGVQLVEVKAGVRTTLGKVSPALSLPAAGVWLKVALKPLGDTVRVQVQRADTGQYLTASGGWQSTATDALTATTTVKPTTGLVGVGRLTGGSGMAYLDDFAVLAPPGVNESFDTTRPNPLPGNWQSWASDGAKRVSVGGDRFLSSDSGLGITGTSVTSARAWLGSVITADAAADVAVYVDNLTPSGVFARGANLNTSTPSYYSLTLTRGLTVQLNKVVNGVTTSLGSVKSKDYVSGQWIRLTLRASGDQLRGLVYRTDTGKWLAADGTWKDVPEAAFAVADKSITAAGHVGVERGKIYAGTTWFDDLQIRPAGSNAGPQVAITASQAGTTFSDVVTFTATATPASAVAQVEFSLDGKVKAVRNEAPATWDLDTTALANGPHTLSVRVLDADGNSTTKTFAFTTSNDGSNPDPERPEGVRKYTHIRLAMLAYAGNPMGTYEQTLAKNSLDLIVPNTAFLQKLESAAADTPKVIYSNISNLYGGLLTDWFAYAAANGADRESAFYHVTQATAFSGQSAASVPVREFWGVYRGAATGTGSLTDLTYAAKGAGTGVDFGGVGQAVHIGWTDRFREINFTAQKAASGWGGTFEYVSAVNADGSPKTWKTLTLLSNGTSGFTESGQLIFDPPADWKASVTPGTSHLLYYVRAVTTKGTGPVAKSLFGRDYVNASGGNKGTIPAFDSAADANGDGYLTDAEYSKRKSGYNARFVHESRLFYPTYGQMRFVTNPSSVAVEKWAADYHERLLDANPLADGVFLDNSHGKLPFAGTPVKESVATFTDDLAAAIGAITRALPGKWVVSNTAGSIKEANAIAEQSTAAMEEFLLRPNDHNWSAVLDTKNLVDGRLASDSPSPYVILDTLPGSGDVKTERTRMGALSYYYLLADPVKTFLMFFGGYSPSAAWDKVFVPAATYDVGQPAGDMFTFASGTDPQNAKLTYKVYAREYENALVLFKPRSYTLGQGTGTADQATATTHQLNGKYRQLYSDGSLGQVITSIKLMNSEGVVLVKA